MECPNCEHQNRPGAKFCARCRTGLQHRCPRCGSVAEHGDRFCAECGADLPLEPAAAPVGARLQPPTTSDARPEPAQAENRLLTILFADLTGSVQMSAQLLPEDAAARVNDVFRVMVGAVLKYEGHINRLLGDEMLAFFGTPRAHENDPERAILAALEIREAVQRLGMNVTAGINTGAVYLGEVGAAQHQEWTAMGSAINLAARLRSKAEPGQILVGEATWRHTFRAFEFERRALELKGLAQVAAAYEVIAPFARPEKVRGIEGLHAELIGRDDELSRVRASLDAALQGRGQVVSIVGEAGLGKSRLIAELKAGIAGPAVDQQALLWLEGRCLEMSMAVSYAPFLDLLRQYFGWGPDDGAPARAQTILTALDEIARDGVLASERVEEIGPLLGNLLSVRFGNDWDDRVRNTSPEQIKRETFAAIRDFLFALSKRRAIVLVLEDLHWADRLSLDLVALLMETLSAVPTLLVCAYRPEHQHQSHHLAAIARRTCADSFVEIRLRELPPEQGRQLIEQLLRVEALPGILNDRILAQAQGNPFFVEEVVRTLIDSRIIYRDGERWRASGSSEGAAIPESVQGVILSRIDRLDPQIKDVLQRAAVVGRLFGGRLLAELVPDKVGLERALRELMEHALIYKERTVPEDEYSFRHVLTQETVYHNILRRRRMVLHQEVAGTIEQLYGARLDEYAEQLAHHYDQSGVLEKAVEYLVRAGKKSARNYANQQAIDYFRRAAERLVTLERDSAPSGWREEMEVQLYEGLGDVLELTGQHDAARGAYEKGSSAATAYSAIAAARLYRKISLTWENQRHYDEALKMQARAQAALGPAPLEPDEAWYREWLEIQTGRLGVHYWRSELREMDELVEQVRPVVERFGTAAQRSSFLWSLGLRDFRRYSGVVTDETTATSRASLAAAEEAGNQSVIAVRRFGLGMCLLLHNELDEAEHYLEAALALAERVEDPVIQTRSVNYLLLLYRKRGQVDRVRHAVERTHALATEARLIEYVASAAANAAWLAWRDNDWSQADAHARAALELWRQAGRKEVLMWTAVWPLLAVALRGDALADAITWTRELFAAHVQPPPPEIEATLQAALTAWDGGSQELARIYLEQAAEMARPLGFL